MLKTVDRPMGIGIGYFENASDPIDRNIGRCFIEQDLQWIDFHNDSERTMISTLWSFEIYENHRGKGHGQKMILEVIALCESLEIDQLFLKVMGNNHRAIHIYEKVGFSRQESPYMSEISSSEKVIKMVCKIKGRKGS